MCAGKMKLRESYTCPLEIAHDIVRGKWKTIIVFQLRDGGRSFSALLRSIVGVSEKMLLQQLKELRRFGLVGKSSAPGYPLHVEYFLTPRGKQLLRAVEILQEIGAACLLEQERAQPCQETACGFSQTGLTKK